MRSWPLLVIALRALAALAAVSEALQWVQVAGDNPGLVRHEQRGLLVIARGVVAFLLGIFAGILLGRTLSSILLATALSGILVMGTNFLMDAWRRTEAQVLKLDVLTPGSPYLNGMMMGSVSKLPDGSITSERNLENLPLGTDFDWWLMIAGDQYWTWIGREVLLLAAIAVAVGAIATVRMSRRTPI